jgi:GNAT superfamily N-acetyltransferase
MRRLLAWKATLLELAPASRALQKQREANAALPLFVQSGHAKDHRPLYRFPTKRHGDRRQRGVSPQLGRNLLLASDGLRDGLASSARSSAHRRYGMAVSGREGMTREERVALESSTAFSSTVEAGGAIVLSVPEAPESPMLNRVVGLGIGRPATEASLDEALAAIGAGVTFYVAVAPGARPVELPDWLQARGLEPGWGWMTFRRDVEAPPSAETALRLVEVDTADGAAVFSRIVRVGFGLPETTEPRLARMPDSGWLCWLAFDGDEPAGGGALYVAEGVAYLSFAATLPAHRGKGAQNALLAARIRRAAELGCDLVITETGERRDDQPSNSYRNILRAGFREDIVTANWLGRS